MMVMGAVAGFGAALMSGSPWVGVVAAILAGVVLAAIFALPTLKFVSHPVAT
eukprot:gene23053-24395_t